MRKNLKIEKKMACFFLFNDLNTICPMYCKSMNTNAAKYKFSGRTAWLTSVASELKIRISASGASRITLHVSAVYSSTSVATTRMDFRTRAGRLAP